MTSRRSVVAIDDGRRVFGAHVAAEIAGLSERLEASRTAIGAGARVHSSVTDQRGTAGE